MRDYDEYVITSKQSTGHNHRFPARSDVPKGFILELLSFILYTFDTPNDQFWLMKTTQNYSGLYGVRKTKNSSFQSLLIKWS